MDPSDPKGVVIGRRLARTRSVGISEELIVLTQAPDGSVANELFIVRGVLMSIAEGADRTAVYMNEAMFREMMVLPTGAHQIIVRRRLDMELSEAAVVVESIVAGRPEAIKAMTWKALNPLVAQMLEGTQGVIAIVFVIFYFAVAILILNAMLMAVFERIREFGVLKAVGVGPFQVFSMILIESGIQTLIALIVGLICAIPGMWYLGTHGIDVGILGGTDMMGIALRPVWYGIYRIDSMIPASWRAPDVSFAS